jgi:hypothetical protein
MSNENLGKITATVVKEFELENFGIYAIVVKAKCNSGSKEENLRVEIDDIPLREIPPVDKPQYFKAPPAWNGTQLKGLPKTVIFLTQLNKGPHTLRFIPDPSATVDSWEWEKVENLRNINFPLNRQADEGDGRPWITVALLNLPLSSFSAEISVTWHYLDGDDVKFICDGVIEQEASVLQPRKMRNWIWSARPWQVLSGARKESKTLIKNLSAGIHYLELWADKTPTIHQLVLDLGEYEPKRIPTVNDPLWTGNFSDDTETMILARLIFGEARNQTKDTMKAIGCAVRNRVKAGRSYFGSSYHGVINKHVGSIYQFSCMNPAETDNFPLLINPFKADNPADRRSWFQAYEMAEAVILGASDVTQNATYFHSADLSQELFTSKHVPGAVFTVQIGKFLFYLDPNDV